MLELQLEKSTEIIRNRLCVHTNAILVSAMKNLYIQDTILLSGRMFRNQFNEFATAVIYGLILIRVKHISRVFMPFCWHKIQELRTYLSTKFT
jgi:hypothetical protein